MAKKKIEKRQRSEKCHFLLTPGEKTRLEMVANARGLSVSAYVRTLIDKDVPRQVFLYDPVAPYPTPREDGYEN